MRLSRAYKSDCELFGILRSLPLRYRTRVIHKFLSSTGQRRLTEHVARLLNSPPSHIVDNPEFCRAIHATLSPHKTLINKFIKKARSKKLKKDYNLSGQKGGALFSLIIGGLLPLLADVIIRDRL